MLAKYEFYDLNFLRVSDLIPQNGRKSGNLYAVPSKRTKPKIYENTLTKHKKNASTTIFFLITHFVY